MTDVFNWQPLSESGGEAAGDVRRTVFGDGYSQSSPDGINPIKRKYQLKFGGPKEEMEPIVAFIVAHIGQSFLWTPPFGGPGYYQCDGYSDSGQGGQVYTIAATFEQTYQP